MKCLVLLVLVFGFAHGNKEEDVSLQELNALDHIFSSFNIFPVGFARDAKNILSTLKNDEGPMATMRAVDKVIKIKNIVDAIVQPIAQLAIQLLEFANGILAIVGLVLLIIYLIDGGDVKALLGTGRSLATWSTLDFSAINGPTLETISEIFLQAMHKYEESV